MKAYGGVDAYIHVFYTPVVVGVSSASCFGCFTPWETCSFAYVIIYYAMKAYEGVDVYILVLFGEGSVSGPGRFTHGNAVPMLKNLISMP
jgi:hypothetical protein